MRGKLNFLSGAAVGYVLGARAGRGRYEQIKTGALRFWTNPTVQAKVSDASDTVKAKAPAVQHKVAETAKHAADTAKSKFSGGSDIPQPGDEFGATPFDPTQANGATRS